MPRLVPLGSFLGAVYKEVLGATFASLLAASEVLGDTVAPLLAAREVPGATLAPLFAGRGDAWCDSCTVACCR